jgi:hypothetical protein
VSLSLPTAPLFTPLLCQPQPLWLGIHPFKQSHREVEKISRIFLFQRTIMCAIVSVLSDAFRKVVKVFGYQTIFHQPFDPRTQVAAFASRKSGSLLFGQERLRSQIDSQPKHGPGSIPILYRYAGSSFSENCRNLWRSMLRRSSARPVGEIYESVNFKKVVQRAAISCGLQSILLVVPYGASLNNQEHRRPVTMSTPAERLEPVLPIMLLAHEYGRQNIERCLSGSATRAVNYQFGHVATRSLISFPASLPNQHILVERVAL